MCMIFSNRSTVFNLAVKVMGYDGDPHAFSAVPSRRVELRVGSKHLSANTGMRASPATLFRHFKLHILRIHHRRFTS